MTAARNPMKYIRLTKRERIVAVVPDVAAGPGWCNAPTWVYIESDGNIRRECIQPEERSQALHYLHAVGVALCDSLITAVPVKIVQGVQS